MQAFAITLFICGAICKTQTIANSTRHNSTTPESIQGLWLRDISAEFAQDFNNTSNEELGISFIQQMYGKFKYTTVLQDADKKLQKISSQLEVRLNETFSVLNQTRHFIEGYIQRVAFLGSAMSPCNTEDYNFEEYEVTNMLVNPSNSYIEQVNLNQVLRSQISSNKILKTLIKQQYFLSHHDIQTETQLNLGECHPPNDALLWSSYMSRIQYAPRNILLLLDHGGSLSKQQLYLVKAIAAQAITTLTENDKIGVIAISQEVTKPLITQQCILPNLRIQQADSNPLITPSKHNKKLLLKFVDGLIKGNGSTNHSVGFQSAFDAILASNIPKNETVMILYVSRGLLSSLTEARLVLETILNQMDEAEHNIVINTCAVIDASKQVMYETHFLRDIAEQNYTKYNIDFDDIVQKGIMLPVNSTGSIGITIARFYNTFFEFIELVNAPMYEMSYNVSLPKWDPQTEQLIVTAMIPCGKHGEIGVLGMDLYFANLVEDVTYYSNYPQYSYAFLFDLAGVTVMHPNYPRPSLVKEQPNFTHIRRLEMGGAGLMANASGTHRITQGNLREMYVYKRILDVYVLAIVVKEMRGMGPPRRPFKVNWFSSTAGSQLVHHRLDIIPASRMCKHFNQLATLDAGTLYLSPSCFQSPTTFLHSSTSTTFSPLSAQKCMAFLKDNTRFLSNPGLREEIRDDVAMLAHILDYLRTQHLQGIKGRYIVRRYVTSPTGVMQTFPGGVLAPGYEPTKRSWYLRAVEHRGKTVLTPPYLDAGGAGYIVTMSYATEFAVVSIDVTFGYVFKLILERMPFCGEKKLKCFMMDDSGYLIYHPNLIDPNGHGPIEQQHIIHKEPQVANDLLYHGHFIRKKLCNNYADDTIQRFYKLNTSIDEVIVNAVNGEHNARYQVSPIQGTNVFIGFVNVTEESTTFCPCSMINRLCLNCNRMEQKECECPCECPLDSETCRNKSAMGHNPVCSIMPEVSSSIPTESQNYNSDETGKCLPIACEKLTNYESCLGVLGCEWCQIDVDAETLLSTPFCTSIQTCFNGILGSPTPYGDSSDRSIDGDDLNGYSPIGPVIGSVLALCLIVIFSFICYRSYTSSSADRFYLTAAQENQVRMSDLNISDDYHELDNHQKNLLQDSKKPEPISPYCVSTGYRRPATAADSDHGYSTMTPHDESEHLSFAPHEIDSLEDETSDGASINTSVSTKRHRLIDRKGKKLLSEMTSLPNRNRIIAPVTVHRNMEYAQ